MILRHRDSGTSSWHWRSVWRRMMTLLANARGAERMAFESSTHIVWRDRFGVGHAQAVSQDISETGMAIRCTDPIPSTAKVCIRSEKLGGTQWGSVRYCIGDHTGYIIGLQFESVNTPRVGERRSEDKELDLATDGMTW